MKLSALLCLFFPAVAQCGEILIHEGPTVSLPGLQLEGPGGKGTDPPDLTFTKQFFTDEKNIRTGAGEEGARRTTASRAIELTLASLEKDYDPKDMEVIELELHKETSAYPSFFIITNDVKGSEEHRIVLMNGTVIAPRLKRVD